MAAALQLKAFPKTDLSRPKGRFPAESKVDQSHLSFGYLVLRYVTSTPNTSAFVAVPEVSTRLSRNCMICPAEQGAARPAVEVEFIAFTVAEAVEIAGAHNADQAGSSVEPIEVHAESTAHWTVPEAVPVVQIRLMSMVPVALVSPGIW